MLQLHLIVRLDLNRPRCSGQIAERAARKSYGEWRARLEVLAAHEFPTAESGISPSGHIHILLALAEGHFPGDRRDPAVVDVVACPCLFQIPIEERDGADV